MSPSTTACAPPPELIADVDVHAQVGAVANSERFDGGRTRLDPDAFARRATHPETPGRRIGGDLRNHNIEGIAFQLKSSVTPSGCTIGSR